nr:protein FAR1-RELATED SEQUENCE 5-like [Setaria viridis]
MIKGSGFTGHLTCISKFAHRMLNFIQHTNHTAAGELHWSQAGNLWLTLQPFDGHLSRSWQYAWFQHSFRVEADVRSGRYTCECKTWEHTGLFCTHLIKAFTYIQIDNIPAEYIMKRYTRSARTMVMWERHDIVTSGPGYKSNQYKTKKLIEIAMAAMRACRKISLGFEKGCEQLSALVEWGESIARGTGASQVGNHTEE